MANKYHRLKKQYSMDGGNTWHDVTPYEYMKGSQMSDPYGDCTDVEWREVEGEYICTENGDYVPTVEYRWVEGDAGVVMCFDGSLYNTLKGQYSRDGGMTWQDTGATMTNEIIEPNSECCDGNTYICGEPTPDAAIIPTFTSWQGLYDTECGIIETNNTIQVGVYTFNKATPGTYNAGIHYLYTKENERCTGIVISCTTPFTIDSSYSITIDSNNSNYQITHNYRVAVLNLGHDGMSATFNFRQAFNTDYCQSVDIYNYPDMAIFTFNSYPLVFHAGPDCSAVDTVMVYYKTVRNYSSSYPAYPTVCETEGQNYFFVNYDATGLLNMYSNSGYYVIRSHESGSSGGNEYRQSTTRLFKVLNSKVNEYDLETC